MRYLRTWPTVVLGAALTTMGVLRAASPPPATHVSGWINANTTWTVANSPYIVDSTVGIGSPYTLTIEPGVVVKINGMFTSFLVAGGATLVAEGTATDRITFTSIQDDSIAGDSGGDGATVGAPGQWYSMFIDGTATFDYVDVRFGGLGTYPPGGGVTAANGSTVDVDHSTFKFNQASGFVAQGGSTVTIAHSQFMENSYGVSILDGGGHISGNSSLSSNSVAGLYINLVSTYTGPAPTIEHSEITGNGWFGVRLLVSTGVVATSMPQGHYNNIYGNGSGSDMRQLSTHEYVPTSSWTNNYWGAVYDLPCPYAGPGTPGGYLTYDPKSYCTNPGPSPGEYYIYYPQANCPNNQPLRCASAAFSYSPFQTSMIDNSGY